MNKTLTISVIVLVAVIMGIGAISPMIPQALAHDVSSQQGQSVQTANKMLKLTESISFADEITQVEVEPVLLILL